MSPVADRKYRALTLPLGRLESEVVSRTAFDGRRICFRVPTFPSLLGSGSTSPSLSAPVCKMGITNTYPVGWSCALNVITNGSVWGSPWHMVGFEKGRQSCDNRNTLLLLLLSLLKVTPL